MNKFIVSICLMLLITQCNSIKNDKAKVAVEEATTITDGNLQLEDGSKLYGFWVGEFAMDFQEDGWPDEDEEDFEYSKKINISIDKIEGEIIEGHSVVAGNYRPFTGSIKKDSGRYFVEAKEPGDHPHDGVFKFHMNDTMLYGTWVSNDIKDSVRRKYELKRRVFQYNPDTKLEEVSTYVDYKKSREAYIKYDENDSFMAEHHATATEKIYEINASNTVLTATDVSNLKKGDLIIIRNAIYARHGYSFKNKALRMFFDAQEWYIPVNSDIKDELSETEKNNIELLMTYEKNAEEYYDYFGRF